MFFCPSDPAIRVAVKNISWAADPGSSADPFVRVPKLVADGIEAELIFPTLSWALLGLEPKLRSACLRAYNSWIWNLTTSSPRRFHGVAMLPPGAEAIAELQRVTSLGLKAAVVPVEAGGEIGELANIASASGMPLMLVRPDAAMPFADFAAFSAACADLTRHAVGRGSAVKFLIPAAPERNLSDQLRYLTGDRAVVEAAPQNTFWGRFGGLGPYRPAKADVNDEAAAAFFRIPPLAAGEMTCYRWRG